VGSAEETISLEERKGLYDVVRDSFIEHGTPLVFEGPCDSFFYPYHESQFSRGSIGRMQKATFKIY